MLLDICLEFFALYCKFPFFWGGPRLKWDVLLYLLHNVSVCSACPPHNPPLNVSARDDDALDDISKQFAFQKAWTFWMDMPLAISCATGKIY